MVAIYGQLFVTKHGVRDSGIWFETLCDLTPKALESGMARLKGLSAGTKFCDWPPNPLQFKALCEAYYENLRLPSPSVAYLEIKNKAYLTRQNWSNNIVKFMASRLPSDFLDIDDSAHAYALFKEAYEQVCSLVKQGHVISETNHLHDPVMQLKKPQDISIAHRNLAAMKQRLGV